MKKNLIILFTILFMLMASPPLTNLAYARGWGWGPSICIGGFFGALLGWILGTQTPRPVVVAQPPPPPPICQREIPGHWEQRWNLQGFYERMWVPLHVESFPCRASSPQLLPPPHPPLTAPPAPYDPSPVAPSPSHGYNEPAPTTREPGTGKFHLRLPLVRLRQILTQKDVKCGHQPVSFTMSHAGIRKNRLWKPFQCPTSPGRIIPASSPFYPGYQRFLSKDRSFFTSSSPVQQPL